MPNDFCILTLLRHLTTFLFGMKTLDWIILMQTSEFATLRIDNVLCVLLLLCLLTNTDNSTQIYEVGKEVRLRDFTARFATK